MHPPLISITIPSLNQGKFIGKTLQSIIDQNYPNIEIIVMDGGSMDSTVKTIKDFELKIKNSHKSIRFFWMSKKDKGQANAINSGWKKAKGDILCYLNSDDYLLPGTLKRVAHVFTKQEKVDWVTGDYIIVNEMEIPIQHCVVWYKRFFRLFPLRFILSITNPIIQPSTFLRKSFVGKIGFFDETLSYTFDYEYWLRCVRASIPFLFPEALSAFRIHGASKGTLQFRKQFDEELSVISRFTTNIFVLKMHQIHSWIIVSIYNKIKYYN